MSTLGHMPDICETLENHPYRPAGPEDDTEGPWFYMGTDQLRKIAKYSSGHDGTIKLEYRGAGYWALSLIGPEGGEVIGQPQLIYALETP
jgi:hypothetical protein